MTKRQREYWREQYKFANYSAVLKAVKGPSFKDESIPDAFKHHLDSMTTYLRDKNHEMYLILKSLGALKKAAGIKETGYLTKEELDTILSDVSTIDERNDSSCKEGEDDD